MMTHPQIRWWIGGSLLAAVLATMMALAPAYAEREGDEEYRGRERDERIEWERDEDLRREFHEWLERRREHEHDEDEDFDEDEHEDEDFDDHEHEEFDEDDEAEEFFERIEMFQRMIELMQTMADVSKDPEVAGVFAVMSMEDNVEGERQYIEELRKALDGVRNEAVRRAVRLKLADLYKETDQHDRALEQLHAVIRSIEP